MYYVLLVHAQEQNIHYHVKIIHYNSLMPSWFWKTSFLGEGWFVPKLEVERFKIPVLPYLTGLLS